MGADLAADPPLPRSAQPERSPARLTAAPGADLHLVLQADFLSVRHVLRVVRARLGSTLSASAAGNLELVLAEVMNNIVRHAYHGQGGRIDLRIGAEPNALFCRLTDQGSAMPTGGLPDPPRPCTDLPVADLPEGGFGWWIVLDLAEDLQYRRTADRNVVQFRMVLN